MGIGLLISLLLLLFLTIGVIALLIYSRKRNSKVGQAFSILFLILITMALFTNKIDQLTISKEDIKNDLSILKVELIDDFKIVDNKVSGMPERIQSTEILISFEDKNRIINQIKRAGNFKELATQNELLNSELTNQFGFSDEIFNFKYPKYYSMEMNARVENFPTRLFLSVYEETNIIGLQLIEQ